MADIYSHQRYSRPSQAKDPYYSIVCFGTPSVDPRKGYYRSLSSAKRDMDALEGGSMTGARIVRCSTRQDAIDACWRCKHYVMGIR